MGFESRRAQPILSRVAWDWGDLVTLLPQFRKQGWMDVDAQLAL